MKSRLGTPPSSESATLQQYPFSQWLDGFRWVAALCVVLAHCSNRFLVHLSDVPHAERSPMLYTYTFSAGFAHEAVMVFFVLSGFLVGGGLWSERVRTGTMQVKRYMLKRVSRLCIVLYPAFLLIIVCNLIGIYGLHGLRSGVYDSSVLHRTGAGTLACNAMFMQTAVCDTYGNDGALWSLFNEFWYYLLWPIVILSLFRSKLSKQLGWLLMLCVVLITLTFLPTLTTLHAPQPSLMAAYMLIWLLGVPVAARNAPLLRSSFQSSMLLSVVLLGSRILVRRTMAEEHPIWQFLADLVLGLAFANLLLTLKHDQHLRYPPLGGKNRLLADFSFSLYCIHIPVLNLYAAVVRRISGQSSAIVPKTIEQWLTILGAIASSVVGAYLFSLVTEAHTLKVRRWLEAHIPMEGIHAQPTTARTTT